MQFVRPTTGEAYSLHRKTMAKLMSCVIHYWRGLQFALGDYGEAYNLSEPLLRLTVCVGRLWRSLHCCELNCVRGGGLWMSLCTACAITHPLSGGGLSTDFVLPVYTRILEIVSLDWHCERSSLYSSRDYSRSSLENRLQVTAYA